MPYKEIFFKISSMKEEELFAYISETCHCKIVNPVVLEQNKGVFKKGMPIISPIYIIVDDSVDFKIQYKRDDSVSGETKYILELPQNGSFTYISYERFDYCNNTEASNRLFVVSDKFLSFKKSATVCKFKKIETWIKSNSKNCVNIGRINMYVI